MKPDPLSRSAVAAAMELHERRLWQIVKPDAAFLIRVPGEEFPLVATIAGHPGADYGFALARGERAMARFITTVLGRGNSEPFMESLSLLFLDFEPVAGVSPQFRQLSLDAGYQVRADGLVPIVSSKVPQRVLRPANRTELRMVRDCVRAILAVNDAGHFAPGALDLRRRRILEIVIDGEPRDARCSWTTFPEEAAAAVPQITTFDDLPPDLPRLDERWLLALADPDASPEEEEDEGTEHEEVDDEDEDEQEVEFDGEGAPGVERSVVLLVVEESSRRVVGVVPLASGTLDRISDALKQVFLGEQRERRELTQQREQMEQGGEGVAPATPRRGLPREIAFDSERLRQSLDRALEKLGIATSHAPDHPVIVETADRFAELLDRIARQLEEESRLFAPMPKTLSDWKEADRAFTSRCVEELERSGPGPDRALTRYFGSSVLGERILEEFKGLQPYTGFIEWVFTDYRATTRSKTFLERRLERREITSREYALIDARRQATLSLYRVLSTQPGATLEVEDVLTGARSTVHDRALSGCDVADTVLPLRLLRFGAWTCCIVAGPPLGPVQLDRAMHELESHGVELTPEGLRRKSHLLGRLWWLELEAKRELARGRPPVELRNTDGEKLEWISATFRVADAGALRAAFEARDGVDFEWETKTGCWTRPGPPAPGMGDNTVLAHLDLLGEQLVVEVNSQRRLARVREWVERIPGVAFERFTRKEFSSKAAPLDDRLKSQGGREPLPPELLAKLASMQRESARCWLDTPVPALQDRTPRAACRTEAGRRRVAILIRTMPDLSIPGGKLPAPRAELLKELGLEAGA